MNHPGLLILTSILTACSTSSELGAVDSKSGQSIYCSGSAYNWDMCYEKASEICGEKEYEIVQKYEDEGAFAAYKSAQELPSRRLIIQCKQ